MRTEINLKQQIGDLATLRSKYAINESISHRMEGLVKQGAMAQLELDRQNERQLELLSTIRRTEQEINAARGKVSESNLNRQQVTAANGKQLYPQYDNVRQQLIDGNSRLAEINERIRLSQVVAPITGRIFDLNVKPGEITNAAKPILKLIPDHDLEVELAISNRDIGFLEPGMPVDVRVTSFPFTDYGSLKGTLLRVGADALPADPQNPQEYFPAKVRIDRNVLERRGRSYNLRPGMAVTALIQLGSRPVISLISDRFGAFVESSRTIR
jgi:HlyD family secretion protein